MAQTRTMLANRALEKLMEVGSGQSPDSEDTEHVDDAINSFAEFISAAGIYTISDLNDIELAAFEPLADYLAWFVAPDFGKPREEAMRAMAEYMLRRITAPRPSYETMRTENF